MFSGLKDAELAALAESCDKVRCPAGTRIIRQGEMGSDLYIIREGEVSVRLESPTGSREIVKLDAGALFGEMSLFDAYPRSATVIALCESLVYIMDKDSFGAVSRRYPDILFEMCRMFSGRLRNTNKAVVQSDR